MDNRMRILETVVILEQGGPDITEPQIEVTEKSYLVDLENLIVQEVSTTPDYIEEQLHQLRGGFEVVELTIGSTAHEYEEILFPGFKYLGPGNTGWNGPPANAVDAAAMQHDKEYDQIEEEYSQTGDQEKAFRALQESDRKFCETVKRIKPRSFLEQLGKIAGVVALGVKRFVEKHLGYTIYPHLKDPKHVAIDYLDKYL